METRINGDLPREGLAFLRHADPALARWIKIIGPIQLKPQRPYFRSLCRAIIAQQISNKAAATMIERCFALCPQPARPKPEDILNLEDERLQLAGISRQKRRYLKCLAQAWLSPPLKNLAFSKSADEEIIRALTAVMGIGRWTAQMFLLFSLGRPDIFSGDDLALRAGICRIDDCDTITSKQAEERARTWAPWRSLASLYLWRISHWG